jgi:hypothetical protein
MISQKSFFLLSLNKDYGIIYVDFIGFFFSLFLLQSIINRTFIQPSQPSLKIADFDFHMFINYSSITAERVES